MTITSLSPSMVNTFRICARRFYYAEVVREAYLSNPALALGAAIHEMARENYWQKRETEKDLPVDLLTDFFCEDLEYRDDVDWSSQSLDDTKDKGVISVRAYMAKVAPKIQPLHVEHQWSMNVQNRDWTISGKTDLIDDRDQVVDLKTTGRKVSKPKDGHEFQVATYVAAWRAQTGLDTVQGRLDYVVTGRDDTISIPVEFNGDLGASVVAEFDDVAGWIQREQWQPNRHYNNLCSRRYCSFWNACEKDCGGTVKP